jgi:hypothetical protein
MTATHERAAAPTKETAAHIIKNSPQDTDSSDRFNQKSEQGAHAILQPRAERNAKILLALWMDHGRIPALDIPTDHLPTEPLALLADRITDALARGRRSWPEVFEDTADKAVMECDQALRDHEAKHGETSVAAIRKELNEFHQVKARQLAAWRLQAALDKGKETAPIIAELAALDAEAVDGGNLLARAYRAAFNPDSIPPPDETCMAIGEIPVAARGNLTALQGKSKVGKSAVVSAILGAAQRGEYATTGDTLCFEWKGKAEGAIIHCDTEQSQADWHALVRRSVTRSGLHEVSERLVSLPLVMFARGERLAILEGALARETDRQGGIDAVIIDGIADLCTSPNDEAESLELVSRVHALGTDQGKTRGHLGSELNRKAFANLRIDKDTETGVSTIYGTDMRKRDLPREQGFCFGWDEAAGMHTYRGRAAGLKAAEREAKDTAAAREFWEPIFDFASQRENSAFPALTSKEAAEIERELSGNEKTTKPDTMKKRMQKAESLGVLRKFDLLKWSITQAGKAGNEREN